MNEVDETAIRAAVVRALGHFGITEDDIEMPCRVCGPVSVQLCKDVGSTFRRWSLDIPNWQLAEMIWGDDWEGDCVDAHYQFDGGGYSPVTFRYVG